jgi:hypothetical protein
MENWFHESLPQWFWVAWPWIKAASLPLLAAFMFLTMFWKFPFIQKRKQTMFWGVLALALVATFCLRFFVFQPESSGTEKQTDVTEVVQQDQQIAVEQQNQEQKKEDKNSWLAWGLRAGISLLFLLVWLLIVQRIWKGQIFRDERCTKDLKALPLDWLSVISLTGFIACWVIASWVLHWALLPAAWFFWRLGSVSMPKDSEAWVPKWKERSWRISTKASEVIKKYGEVFFWADDAPTLFKSMHPIIAFLLSFFGVARWVPLYLTVVVSRGLYDEEIPFEGFLDEDGIPVSGSVLVTYRLCQNVQRFLTLGESERANSLKDSNDIVLAIVPDLVARKGWSEMNKDSDRLFNDKAQIWDPKGGVRSALKILAKQVLTVKGHNIVRVSFGAIKPPKDVQDAKQKIQLAEAQSQAQKASASGVEALGLAEAAVEKAKAAAPAQGLVEASGNTMNFAEARKSIVDETKAKATRTIIEGNAVPLVPLPPQP